MSEKDDSTESDVSDDFLNAPTIADSDTDSELLETIEGVWEDSFSSDISIEGTIKRDKTSAIRESNLMIKEHRLQDSGADMPVGVDEPDFEILSKIGEGGMGVIYSARQTSLNRSLALKMIKGEGDDSKDVTFISEASIQSDLDHPNVAPLHELGLNEKGQLFCTMKLVTGASWKETIKEKSTLENLDILMRVCDAVAFAHAKGIIHRDLKPENVMLGEFGEVLLMDWGLAGRTAPEGGLKKGSPSGGTPAYMAPEMTGDDNSLIGSHTDIYLLGAMLYEIITSHPPHGGSSVMQAVYNAAKNKIKKTDKKGELTDIAMKAMSADPEKRYKDVSGLQAAINNYRQHAESIGLAERAEEDLQRAGKTGSYDDYAQALFGFREALELWDENTQASEGIINSSLKYAECAFNKDDLDLASSLLNEDTPEHKELAEKINAAGKERIAKQKRLKLMNRISAAAGILITVGAVTAALWISAEKKKAEENFIAFKAEQQAREITENKKKKLETKINAAAKREWQLIYEDDFSDPDVESRWDIHGNGKEFKWGIRDGQMRLSGSKDYEVLLLKKHIAGDLKLEFDCRIESDYLTDITCFLNADQSVRIKRLASSGYTFQYGGQLNKCNALKKNDLILWEEKKSPLVKGKTFRVTAQKLGRKLTLTVDGEVVFEVEDKTPIRGGVFSRVGLYSWKTDIVYDNIKIYRSGFPVKTDLVDVAEYYIGNGKHNIAQCLLEEVSHGSSGERALRTEQGIKLISIHAKYPEYQKEVTLNSNLIDVDFSNKNMKDEELIEKLKHLSGLKIGNLNINKSHIKSIKSLKGMPLKTLLMQNNQIYSLSPLIGMKLTSLDISGNSVKDLTPLKGMPLESLKLQYCNQIDNLTPLKGMNLTQMNLNGTGVSDIAPLKGMPLKFLRIDGTEVVDISPVKGMPLETIIFRDTHIRDITPLKGMSLDSIDLSGTKVIDISPLKDMPLRRIYLNNTKVSDISCLKNMPLNYLRISGTNVTDLNSIKGMPLRRLWIQSTDISDLSPLKGMPLELLHLHGTKVINIDPLKDMPLTGLDFRNTKVSDFTPLSSLSLNWLRAEHSMLTDLTPLKGMPLNKLYLSGTQVQSLIPLQNSPLNILRIDRTKVNDLTPLKRMKLKELWFTPENITKGIEILRKIKTLKSINRMPAVEFWKKYDTGEFDK
ncbi:MAG: protein kinase domain-containing protein [Planctomycetota bacterium]|jgi:serine/threonine protein kinase